MAESSADIRPDIILPATAVSEPNLAAIVSSQDTSTTISQTSVIARDTIVNHIPASSVNNTSINKMNSNAVSGNNNGSSGGAINSPVVAIAANCVNSSSASNVTNAESTGGKRITLVATSTPPALPAILSTKQVITNQTNQLNHTNAAAALQSSQSSTSHTISGALPASGYLTQDSSSTTQLNVNAMPGNVLQGNGNALKPSPSVLPNGLSGPQLTTINSTNKLTSLPVSLSAIHHPSLVITSSASPAASLTNTHSSTTTTPNMISAVLKQHPQTLVLATSKDGSTPPILVHTSMAGGAKTIQLNNHTTVNASKPSVVTHSALLNQVVSNPNSVPTQQVFFNVPSRAGTPVQQNPGGMPRNLAPRNFLIGGTPLRIAPSQVISSGIRPQLPQGLIPQNNRNVFLIRTPSGEFQLVNVAPSPVSSTGGMPAGIRLVTPATSMASSVGQPMRTVAAPGNMTVTLPVSMASSVRPPNHQITQPLSIQTNQANNAATPSQMSPNTAKMKCKNFLSTLIRLASDQPGQVATNVKNLIQGLIDGMIQPEDFTNQLQRELNSSPQPCLVPFLKKSLPYLRHSLMMNEMTIEGVNAPPRGSVQLPQQTLPQIQIAQGVRPGGPATFRLVGPGLTTQLPGTLLRPPMPGMGSVFSAPPHTTATQLSAIPPPPPPQPVTTTPTPTPTKSTTTKSKSSSKSRNQNAAKEKKSANSANNNSTNNANSFASLRDDDDINDVAAMGGVNLMEESQRMATSTEFVGTQIRSCKDENFLFTNTLQSRINTIASKKYNLEEVTPDIVSLISHAAQEYLKSMVEKLGVIAEHRLENLKMDSRYETTQDIRGQIKFLEELDRLEKKRHEEQEREMLLRAAKSRSKLEDPEQLKLKQKAKEMQRAEQEEVRQREANETALLAIGPRKKMKTNQGSPSSSLSNSGTSNQFSNYNGPFSSSSKPMRRMTKRVVMRDAHFMMEQERDTVRSITLYKAYAK